MIPVQLTLQGLYSYQEKQTIDFTKLTTANLFGIFGTVGSGKSSVLEAITFAIYGRTDRLNLSGDNRYYNMMNLKSNELLIDFIFETGKDQTAYRAVVKGKRNGKNFEDVKALDRLAYRKNGPEWMPLETERLEEAIGLSYDNFKRTIIIPQGQFQEFLQLGNKDRTQMMKELFNLGKFEFYHKVTSLEAKNNAHKQNIEGQLLQLGAVNPEQVMVYKSSLEMLANDLAGLNKKYADCRKAEEELRQLQTLTQKRAEAENAVKVLLEQEPAFKQLEQKIVRYQQCVVQFKPLLDALKLTSEKVEGREKQIVNDQIKVKTLENDIIRNGKLLETLKPQYEKREELKQKADELLRLLRMKELEQAVAAEAERLKKGVEICAQSDLKLENKKQNRKELEKLIKQQRASLPDATLLSNVKAWYIQKNNLDKLMAETEKEVEKFVVEEKAIRQELSKILEEALFAQLPANADFECCAQYLHNKNLEVKSALKGLDEQTSHIQVKAHLQKYANDLEEGMPCPLCGSLHHPELFKTGDVQEAQVKIDQERSQYELRREQIAKQGAQLNVLEKGLQLTQRHLKDLSDKKSDLLKKSSAQAALFVWDQFRDEKALTKAFQETEDIQRDLKVKETALESLSKEIDQDEKNRERYKVEVEKIKMTLTVCQTELKTIGQQLNIIDSQSYQSIQVPDIENEKVALLQKYASLEKEYGEITSLITLQTKQHDTLKGSLLVNQQELQHDRQQLQDFQKQLDEQLSKTLFHSVDEVRQILIQSIDLDREKQNLAQFNDQLVNRKSQWEQLHKEVGSRVYNGDDHQKLVQEIASMMDQQKQKNQELGKTEELLKKLQKDLENQSRLGKEKEQLELRSENLRTMKSLFKASGFVNFVSSVYLNNLCNAANDRFFQLTRQKLSLEITPDNSFQVRDFMNGGKVRSVKTLSGGQTFQAALSLALALADNIQKITESNQNFFFLDEGFGSLDKDSLSVVFDTLKSLRKENRIVGVISHVEEMQQEIDVHLRIVNQEDKGSCIYASWLQSF